MKFSNFQKLSKQFFLLAIILLIITMVLFSLCLFVNDSQGHLLLLSAIIGFFSCLSAIICLLNELRFTKK